jgi:hypothetical protein
MIVHRLDHRARQRLGVERPIAGAQLEACGQPGVEII